MSVDREKEHGWFVFCSNEVVLVVIHGGNAEQFDARFRSPATSVMGPQLLISDWLVR